jgi:hypothetical protein
MARRERFGGLPGREEIRFTGSEGTKEGEAACDSMLRGF